MKKRQKATKDFVAKKAVVVAHPPGPKLPTSHFCLATLTVLLVSVIGVTAANTVYHGHISINQDRKKSGEDRAELNSNAVTPAAPAKSIVSTKKTSDLVAKYGALANSQTIAAAIKQVESVAGAKAAADRSEALAHGYWRPGASPVEAIMAGYVPPGMPPEQAAMLYRTLPHLPATPRIGPITEEMADRLAGVPDPKGALLSSQGLSSAATASIDQRFIEDSIRSRVGPIQVSLNPSHNRSAEPAHSIIVGTVRERANQTSTIQAQYSYDPYGQQTRVAGTGPDSDFGYAGAYVHQPSGLLVMGARLYSPSLGRWINRDPIEEAGGINLYEYAGNRPTSVIDPSGLTWYPVGTFAPMIGTTSGNLTKGCIDVVNNAVGTVGSRPELAPKTKCWIGPMAYESAKNSSCDGCGVLWGKQGNGNGTNPGPGFNPATSNPFQSGGLFNYFAYYPGLGYAGMNWGAPTNVSGQPIPGASNGQMGYIIPNPPAIFSPLHDGVPANTEMWCKTCK